MLDIILFLLVLLVIYGMYFLKRKYEKGYLPIHQGIVNQFDTMPVRVLNNIIVKQFSYFIRKNTETPLLVKYNIVILVPVYVLMIITNIIPLNINFFTILFSFWFLGSLSESLVESYMHAKISQEYTDSFWQDYLNNNKDNKLKVVVHYAYSPKMDNHLRIIWYYTFACLVVLVYMNHISAGVF